jgi:NAD-dependent deacetylase
VDGLHQAAGSENVIEFHGNVRQLHCLKCEAHYTWEEVKTGKIPPLCRCGYVLKPTVPLFGDHVNLEAASTAEVLATNAQVMLVACTHGDIAPVNRVPMVAKQYGAVIVEVNRLKSLYTDRITDYFLQGEAGEVLTALSREVEETLVSASSL